jgi:hypothetical protein
VVGDHESEVGVELPAAPAPEQVEQAVLVAGDEIPGALASAGVPHAPVHLEAGVDGVGELAFEVVAIAYDARPFGATDQEARAIDEAA